VPTPDPEERVHEAIAELTTKVDTLLKQQNQLLEMVGKLQKDQQPEAESSKSSKKKQNKPKKDQ